MFRFWNAILSGAEQLDETDSMDLHSFADIRQFQVWLPNPMYPYTGRESLRVRENAEGVEPNLANMSERELGWLGIDGLGEFFPARFSDKNPLNIPGPIYGAETDTCCTGPHEAPDNVLLDETGQEFVFRQASTAAEFRDLVSAVICECFAGYGADGDRHWRLSTIREWWRTREDMLRQGIGERWCCSTSVGRWKRALQGEAEGYLQVYGFFVENGRVPVDGDVLPELI